jgi:hypothetical protein
MFWVFKLSFVVDILAFIDFWDFLGYSFKKLANFFSNHLVTLLSIQKRTFLKMLV